MTWKSCHAMMFCSQQKVPLKILEQRIQLLIVLIAKAYTTEKMIILIRHLNK